MIITKPGRSHEFLRANPRRPGWRVLVVAGIVLAAALGSVASATAVPPTPRVRPVALPRDHGAHPGFQIDWWYTVGTLRDSAGRPYFWFGTVWATPFGM